MFTKNDHILFVAVTLAWVLPIILMTIIVEVL